MFCAASVDIPNKMWSEDDMEVLKENAFNVCKQFLEGSWKDITLKEFQFSVVSGGLSNRLFYCSLPELKKVKTANNGKYPNEVLLRVYGPLQDDVSVVIRETTIFMLLSERDMGPKLYGIFSDGRLEQYIPSRSLKSCDMPEHCEAIARELAKVHSLQVPIKKNPHVLTDLGEIWLNFVEENIGKYEDKNSTTHIIERELRKEWQWLNNVIKESDWPVVFCHNDLQGGNILFRSDKKEGNDPSIILIDFEFSCYNYRGFDLGNQFCEWCFDYNTSEFPFYISDFKKFPTRTQQLEFIDAYLDQMMALGSAVDKEQEKLSILHEVMLFRMASSLMWTIWSFKMAMSSSINFAFARYGETRWNFFKVCKEEYQKYSPEFLSQNNNGEQCYNHTTQP